MLFSERQKLLSLCVFVCVLFFSFYTPCWFILTAYCLNEREYKGN